MEKVPMTSGGFQKLQEKLDVLKKIDRPAMIQAVIDARRDGDLLENMAYHIAREQQGFTEGRIKDLEDKIARAEVINIKSLSGNKIMFGARVTLREEVTNEEMAYQIVGVDEADIKQRLLSINSPLAQAIIGKVVGDSCDIVTPGHGYKSYEIMKVAYC